MFRYVLAFGLALSLGAVACNEHAGAGEGTALGRGEQPLFNGPTATSAPSPTTTRPGVGKLTLEGRTCVGTLIHPSFAVGSSNACALYPKPYNDATIALTPSGGTTPTVINISDVRLVKNSYQLGNLLTDVALLKLETPASAASFPAYAIASTGPDDTQTVSSFGFGDFGTTSCTTTSDFKKRGITWSFGGPPYQVCWGDWGAPVFQGPIAGNGDLAGTIVHPSGIGNVVRYKETLYQLMLEMSGSSYLSGSRREGIVHAAVPNVASPQTCESECLRDNVCKGWNYQGTMCSLLQYAGRWVPDASTASGLRPVVDSSFSRTGSLLTSATITGAQGCAASCQAATDCQSWSFAPQTDVPDPNLALEFRPGTCNLYSNANARTAQDGKFTGLRLARPTFFELVGGTYKTAFGVVSDRTCAVRCERESRCLAFTYYPANKRCELKDLIPTPTFNPDAVSDFKRHASMPNVGLDGVALADWYAPSPNTAEQCQTDCAVDGTCTGYTVWKPSIGLELRCKLFSNVTVMYGSGAFDSGMRSLIWQ